MRDEHTAAVLKRITREGCSDEASLLSSDQKELREQIMGESGRETLWGAGIASQRPSMWACAWWA